MTRLSEDLKKRILLLRTQGSSYSEIQSTLGQNIAKGTLSYICRDIVLQPEQVLRIKSVMLEKLALNRKKAVQANRKILENKILSYKSNNQDIGQFMLSRHAKLVALAMLYLGEEAKWSGRRGLMLGSSDPAIIRLYIKLLKSCFDIPLEKFKARIQRRADQDAVELLNYWSTVTQIKPINFYPSYVDKRTIGQTTKKQNYKGVCSITCAGTHIQLELAAIAGIIGEAS